MTGQQNPGQKKPGQQNSQKNGQKNGQQNAAGGQKKQGKGCGCMVGIVIVLMIGLGVVLGGVEEGWFDSADDASTSIPAPVRSETEDLVTRLAEAEKAHGICYGWALRDYPDTVISEGSSRGTNVPASTCDRWVSLDIAIDYAAPSSESSDYAYIDVKKSGDLAGEIPYSTELDRMGITQQAALDDPTATIGMGALALPLLMVEQGVVEALPPTESTAEPATAISRPGSDFIGNHTGAIIALGIIGGIAVLFLIIGLIVRKRGAEAR